LAEAIGSDGDDAEKVEMAREPRLMAAREAILELRGGWRVVMAWVICSYWIFKGT